MPPNIEKRFFDRSIIKTDDLLEHGGRFLRTAIKLRGATAEFKNIKISGFDVGLDAKDSHFLVDRAAFDDVERPFNVEGGSVRANETRSRFSSSPLPRGQSTTGLIGGYSRSSGPRVPCECPQCGSIFPSRTFNIFNARVYADRNFETCPVCGNHDAAVAIGVFQFTVEALKVLAAPETTLLQVEALGRVMASVLAGAPQKDALSGEHSDLGDGWFGFLSALGSKNFLIGAAAGLAFNYSSLKDLGLDLTYLAGRIWSDLTIVSPESVAKGGSQASDAIPNPINGQAEEED